jgi:hypothetical protein
MIQIAKFDIEAHVLSDPETSPHMFVKETEIELLRLSKLLGGAHSRGRMAHRLVLHITEAIPQIKRHDLEAALHSQQALRQVSRYYLPEIPPTLALFLTLSEEHYSHSTFLLRMLFSRPGVVEAQA